MPIIIIFSVGAACQTNTHAPCIQVRTVLVNDGPSHAHSDTRHEHARVAWRSTTLKGPRENPAIQMIERG